MSLNQKAAFALLQKIAFVRTAGSPEELRCAKILQKECEAAGVKAEIEPFAIADWKPERVELQVLTPYQKSYTVTAYKCCGNTPREGLTADFVYAENMTDVDLADIRGKIVLVNGFMRLTNYKRLMESGAAAFISMTGTLLDKEEETDLFTRRLRPQMLTFGAIPAVNLRIADGFELVAQKAEQVKLTVIGENIERTSHTNPQLKAL
ncbi:MAG: hypothetical protein RSC76_07420 [Oscillospiraceae bacterium]